MTAAAMPPNLREEHDGQGASKVDEKNLPKDDGNRIRFLRRV